LVQVVNESAMAGDGSVIEINVGIAMPAAAAERMNCRRDILDASVNRSLSNSASDNARTANSTDSTATGCASWPASASTKPATVYVPSVRRQIAAVVSSSVCNALFRWSMIK
jgi:hypothetical protein